MALERIGPRHNPENGTILELYIPESIPLDYQTTVNFRAFLQSVTNRRCLGALRYGDKPTYKQKYMTRLKKELKAYEETGNAEQLMNIAVYCFLETFAPENKKFHFDPHVDSVTRKEMGGNIA